LKKRFGQHFLSDPSILRRIVQLARITPGDTVLEIGPGRGSLTRELSAKAGRVIAIEIDRDLLPRLQTDMPANVEIVEGDALTVDFPRERFKLVGNLPYNIATPLFKRFIEHRSHVVDVTVMIQKEVADRLAAKPGTSEYGPLSILIQYYAAVTFGFKVPPGAFTPKPKVDSAVIRLDWKPNVRYARPFTDFVQLAFGSRRKKLVNNLLSMYGRLGREEILLRLKKAAINVDARPEDLSVEQFLRVYNHLENE
jgi:16S rRNA (adenine1518-N6/adenine1519-N6)-dimethyltransferase